MGLVPVRPFGWLDAPQLTLVDTFPNLAAHRPLLVWGFVDPLFRWPVSALIID